jgi:hypothetical protein
MRCKYWDCGWCYHPNRCGGCVGFSKCPDCNDAKGSDEQK